MNVLFICIKNIYYIIGETFVQMVHRNNKDKNNNHSNAGNNKSKK